MKPRSFIVENVIKQLLLKYKILMCFLFYKTRRPYGRRQKKIQIKLLGTLVPLFLPITQKVYSNQSFGNFVYLFFIQKHSTFLLTLGNNISIINSQNIIVIHFINNTNVTLTDNDLKHYILYSIIIHNMIILYEYETIV